MRKFKDLNIKPKLQSFIGDKISLSRLFNLEITVHNFVIEPSTKKPGTERLKVQIEKDNTMYIFFTGSRVLMQMIKEVPKEAFPIITTIRNDNGHFEFT